MSLLEEPAYPRPGKNGNDQEQAAIDNLISKFSSAEQIILEPSLALMAQNLYNGMHAIMKQVYYHLIVKENNIHKTAQKMNRSLGWVHNKKREFENYFRNFFKLAENTASYEENTAIMRLLSIMIEQERKKS